MTALDDWTNRVCTELGLDPLTADDRTMVLDLARDVAHGVLRPAAPLTAYLVGLAIGRGAARDTAAAIQDLAKTWPATEPDSGTS